MPDAPSPHGANALELALARLWEQGDAVSQAVMVLLLAMSLVSWCVILFKGWTSWRIRRAAPAVDRFWEAPTVSDGVAMLSVADTEHIFSPLPGTGLKQAGAMPGLGGSVPRTEHMVRLLRQQIQHSTRRIESGLTLLASIGATAPFVGLLGTVWGIYHALAKVSAAGPGALDHVAGPVGEALTMTGAGLAVAIPAVLAYNAFNRINRITLAELDGFAHDLHAYFTRQEAA
ncbi:MotA/TolQ/ExbB proton channel family protein [Massilia sp. PAMC28688]|uniref:MotA/TolQ/ExbB proton channel family protein n=1 Tax=Massilia sp. PAMC28688 TaxID=2861283 RepID=UPI001C63AEE0|nr:MotA/TolQ/ExbB proton channel family protein [Massilia sp. PAMC28688]QYF95558.1 MotA/TolQ/ExbB proton channel family protein [Massilia sp. PAMC28688]